MGTARPCAALWDEGRKKKAFPFRHKSWWKAQWVIVCFRVTSEHRSLTLKGRGVWNSMEVNKGNAKTHIFTACSRQLVYLSLKSYHYDLRLFQADDLVCDKRRLPCAARSFFSYLWRKWTFIYQPSRAILFKDEMKNSTSCNEMHCWRLHCVNSMARCCCSWLHC